MQLRPYQQDALERIEAELRTVRSTLLVLATGLGKTVTFGAVAQRFVARGGRVLVLAHRSELLDQAAATLGRFGLSVGIECGEQRADRAAQVVVASVQTLQRKRLASFARDCFALIIVDEAHHATSASYRAILDHLTEAKVLGVTATPDRADGVGLRNVFESCAYRLELAAGIRGGWLAPLELRSVQVDDLDLGKVKSIAGDFAAGQLEEAMTRDAVLLQVAGPLAELSAGRQTIAFCAGVAQAHALAQVLEGHGVRSLAVDGAMSSEARAAALAAYRSGQVQVVTNAMLYTEGFDAPETSCIALCRPTRSRSLLTQMIGRGTRLAEGKASCLALDFVPARASSMRLASPADVLAGADLPADVAELITKQTRGAQLNLGVVLEHAQQLAATRSAERASQEQFQRAQTAELIRRVGLPYVVTRLSVEELLQAVSEPHRPDSLPTWQRGAASESQIAALRSAGLDVPDSITKREASKLLDVLGERRKRGLCTVKQAKRLKSWGLRDDVTFADAKIAFEVIAENGWRPPQWVYEDPRFAKVARV